MGVLARAFPARAGSPGARLPFEMLHGVCEVDLRPIDTHFFECVFHQPARRADERVSSQVLFIAWNFAYENNTRVNIAFTEHRLSSVLVKITALAAGSCVNQRTVIKLFGQEVGSGAFR
jgi:hypothetical protein